MELTERKQKVADAFRRIFRAKPDIWIQAPGRVDLMGSHTDYNEGFVLTQAIDRNTWIAARPRTDGLVRLGSLNADGVVEFELAGIQFDESLTWGNYPRGVAAMLLQEGYPLQGFDGLIHSTVPFGSGLSSSAALEVATAVLFDTVTNLGLDPLLLAKVCQKAENDFVGMNCGILDQYTSVMGREGSALLLDCRALTSEIKPISSGIGIVVGDTRTTRELTGSEYVMRRAQCEQGVRILQRTYPDVKALRDVSLEQLLAKESEMSAVVSRRCKFIVQENMRVLQMADALALGSKGEIARLTADSFSGARDLYEVSSREMELMIAAMLQAPGVIGARQAGAGFGGCMVAFVESGSVEAFATSVSAGYEETTGLRPEVFAVAAATGAGVLPWSS